MVVPGTNCSQTKFEKFFGPKKGGFSTGINIQIKFFFEFFS
jgi:hypothetical protein